ncbi:MAG: UDP-4-amino-4,6-dideoxy-N-acetyl-beta-L-altrosamine transaminase [Pelagibacteraceae bacterium]|nr:UDP-4-amino-4,6-dideoxy-N-acetyl-beta-L-altrosamine transaminase [Pelagibacteraceae bacterium]|tara:strand:+ start:17177 stop:18337 length:1161 start_codon:yes stop_codon:yes gene_type:complete
MNIPFHKPIIPNSLDEIYCQSIKDGWLTTGPEVKKFENRISDYNEAEYTIAVNSCTAGLHLVLAAKHFGVGDKFIVPTYTFAASVEVGEYLGMRPILVDCDNDYNIDLNYVEDLVRSDSKVKAIIPVHFAGNPVDMKSVFNIADKYGLFVLEDAAHALETRSNFGKIGNTMHAAANSYYANKNITTGGEGGSVSTNDKKLADRVRNLSLHGMSKDGWNRFKTGAKWQYDISNLGYKYNMTDLSASFGMWQIDNIDKWHKKRTFLAEKYQKHLSNIEGIVCPKINDIDGKHAHHLYIIRLIPEKWKIKRNKFIELLNEKGIGTSVHYVPIHKHSYYVKKYGYVPDDFKRANDYSENVISIPLYPLLKNEEIRYIIECIMELWEEFKA